MDATSDRASSRREGRASVRAPAKVDSSQVAAKDQTPRPRGAVSRIRDDESQSLSRKMRTREINLFRRLLEERKRDLIVEAERALGWMNLKSDVAFADPAARATLESDRNLTLRFRDRERKLLAKIDEAFARLNRGTYGRCAECGGEIGLARLKARPVTALCICIGWKSAQEVRERAGAAR